MIPGILLSLISNVLSLVSYPAIADSTASSCAQSNIVDTSVNPIKGGVAGFKINVLDITCSNMSVVGSRVDFLDGATMVWSASLPTLASGGGYDHHFDQPLIGSTNTAFNMQMATGLTTTRCCINYTTSV